MSTVLALLTLYGIKDALPLLALLNIHIPHKYRHTISHH